MTMPPVSSGPSFGKKKPPAPQDAADDPAVASAFSVQSVDPDEFRAFIVESLRPDRLLGSLREQRARRPDYGYCNIVFRRFSTKEATEIGLDHIVRQANADEDIRAAISQMSEYGFQVLIGSYDEPSGRNLQIALRQDDRAELAMRISEGLD
ncbi:MULTISPECIES: hypothetical protein [unclassified Sphingopyxis]|uniref:hypothetical protein n=1 Tax=unclassified Sphingopyxis TaxID=2614943 RepID=UPI00285C0EA2|nr:MULTISPECIES: hypothetical protein [unclassified Sphingopyxis]MDR7060582.1 hypothetical protein [Sphingopyxis sp. BE235]MDR7179905.1 hypothetical protein [Sphingopyxis sp. BE249]